MLHILLVLLVAAVIGVITKYIVSAIEPRFSQAAGLIAFVIVVLYYLGNLI
jgi:hypothetical protein